MFELADCSGTRCSTSQCSFFRIFDQPSGFAVLVTDEHVQDRFLEMFSHEGERTASIPLTNESPDILNSRVEVGNDGASQMEIPTTSGRSCGCLSVPNLSVAATVGRDGSLIVPKGTTVQQCGFRLFPQLLR